LDHGGHVFSDPAFEMDEFGGDPPVTDENKVRVKSLVTKPGESLQYQYDFGDSWYHIVELEKVWESVSAVAGKAVCVAGARACPPEDCGSLPGYADLLRILKNPKHEEHLSMKEWLGRPFDPAHFSNEEANHWLSKLKWPRVTEAALRKILMARDSW
jgi:hypothetical protein